MHQAFGFGDAQIVGVEGQIAGQFGDLHVGDGGMHADRSGDVFHVHIAKNLSVRGDAAFDLGKSQVVAVAVCREVAADLVSGEVVAAVGEVYLDGTRNRAQMRIPVLCSYTDASAESGRGHIASAGVHGDPRRFGHGHREVKPPAVVAV